MEGKKPFLPRMTKNKLSEFDQAQSVGWVLERAIQIEKRIDNIIFNFIDPNNKEAFISHILNSSVMSYGGKLKVLHRIIGYEKKRKKLYNDLQRIGSIRNSFAHNEFSSVMNIHFAPNKGTRQWHDQVISVMKSNGEIDSKNPLEFLKEYLVLLKKVEPELQEIWEEQMSKINNQ
ncbi:hypothetical protein I2486_21320 [Cellulophaga sp. E16_2]|uniref:hypothetical protein n=1 Tax=Cellulophaga sp. E16_2 TaxID=2789297 RepID=UPI001A9180A7|nr:hypothetical protein [Cellulophaga sp. E16_2]MBO0593948.1 hypothetical protein [Cellulophaga sp. E16_2]